MTFDVTIKEIFKRHIATQEKLISRMIRDWRSDLYGEPVVVYSKNYDVVGLAPLSTDSVVIWAKDYREPDPEFDKVYRP